MPATEDLNKAREQATQALGEAVEHARTPLMAALGAGDLAAHAVVDTLNKLREQAEGARAEFTGLSQDPNEFRKRIDNCVQTAAHLYGYLAERGEQTFDRLRAQAPEAPTATPAPEETERSEDKPAEHPAEDSELDDDVLGSPSPSPKRTHSSGSKTSTAGAKSGAKTSTKSTNKQGKPRSS